MDQIYIRKYHVKHLGLLKCYLLNNFVQLWIRTIERHDTNEKLRTSNIPTCRNQKLKLSTTFCPHRKLQR